MGFFENFFIFNSACDMLDTTKPSYRKRMPMPEYSKAPYWLVKLALILAVLCIVGTFVITTYFIF